MNCYQVRFNPFYENRTISRSQSQQSMQQQSRNSMVRYSSNHQMPPGGTNSNFKHKYTYQPKQMDFYPRCYKQSQLTFGLLKESRRRLQKTIFNGLSVNDRLGTRSQDIRYLKLNDSGVRQEEVKHILQGGRLLQHKRIESDTPLHKIFREKNIEPYLRQHRKDKSTQIEFMNEALIKVIEL